MTNLFTPNTQDPKNEQFDTLLQTASIHIEKITSHGQSSDEWYEQDRNEWVVLIEGEGKLLFKETSASQTASACFDDRNEVKLVKGEHIFIPKMKKHKVIYTSSPAIWLAIYFL